MKILASRPAMFLITPSILIFAWWLYVTAFKVPLFLLPPPQSVFSELVRLFASGQIWPHLGHTVGVIAAGFVLGSGGGFALGFVLAKSPRIERIAAPYLLFFQTAPKIALAPLFILWFGLGPLQRSC
jgi:NitT/TauT family transport system permease protein